MKRAFTVAGVVLLAMVIIPLAFADAPPGLSAQWAWVASPAAPGDLCSLSLQVRTTAGSPVLQMTSSFAGAGGTVTPWWRWPIPADGKSHRVEMILDLPPGRQLGLSLAGQGQAQAESLRLERLAKDPDYGDTSVGEVRPTQTPDPLPVDWKPEGTLDARSRELGDTVELVVDVGGLRISSPAEITTYQGWREGPALYISNGGELKKSLQITVQGPKGSSMPIYSLPILPSGTTAFPPPLQLMRVGDWWVKYTFTVGTESASMPLKVHVKRAYPVLMLNNLEPLGTPLPSGDSPIFSVSYLPTGLNFLHDSATLPETAVRLPLLAVTDENRLGDLQAAVKRWDPPLLQFEIQAYDREVPAADSVAAYQKLFQDILPQGRDTAAVSPSWQVTPSDQGLQVGATMKAAFEGGLGKYVQSVGVGVDGIPESGPLLEKIDGKAPAVNVFWRDFDRQRDFTRLRQFLAANNAELPLLLDLSGWAPGASGRVQALALARLMLEATWQGGTGTVLSMLQASPLLSPKDQSPTPEFQTVRELWRELAAAEPMYIPPVEDGSCSHAPDAPVNYWAFLRGSEGIVFVANNTSTPQDLAVEVRGEPVQMQVLRISAFGTPGVKREIQDIFHFSEEAALRHQQAIYMHLAPAQIIGLSITIRGAAQGWLRSIGRKPAEPAHRPGEQPSTLQVPNTDPWNVPQIQF